MPNPPAGWYDDPAGNPSLERFWDGNQWTQQTREIQLDPVPPPPPPPVADPLPPVPQREIPVSESTEQPFSPAVTAAIPAAGSRMPGLDIERDLDPEPVSESRAADDTGDPSSGAADDVATSSRGLLADDEDSTLGDAGHGADAAHGTDADGVDDGGGLGDLAKTSILPADGSGFPGSEPDRPLPPAPDSILGDRGGMPGGPPGPLGDIPDLPGSADARDIDVPQPPAPRPTLGDPPPPSPAPGGPPGLADVPGLGDPGSAEPSAATPTGDRPPSLRDLNDAVASAGRSLSPAAPGDELPPAPESETEEGLEAGPLRGLGDSSITASPPAPGPGSGLPPAPAPGSVQGEDFRPAPPPGPGAGLPPAPGARPPSTGLPPAPGAPPGGGLPPAPGAPPGGVGVPPAPVFPAGDDQPRTDLPPAPGAPPSGSDLPPAPGAAAAVVPPAPGGGFPPAPPPGQPGGLPPAPGTAEDRFPGALGPNDGLPPAPTAFAPDGPESPGVLGDPAGEPSLLDDHATPPPPPADAGPGSGLPPAPAADAGPSGMAPVAPVGGPGPAPLAPEPDAGPSPDVAAGPAMGGFAGIRTELLSDQRYAEIGSGERVVRQNSRLLKVVLGEDVVARQGSMVAFQGAIDFDHEGTGGAGKFMKKAFTGEGLPLMRCTGHGELFLADHAHQVHIIHLDGAALTVNGRNILAFEPSLEWDIERLKGAGMTAGGMFNTRLEGHGWVAITTDGDPVVLKTDSPTFADVDAAVAWSASLTATLNRTVKAKALIGRGSGEAVQLGFQGQGIVLVQPSEGSYVPPHSH